jgi:phosphate transport system substrate-binding protein
LIATGFVVGLDLAARRRRAVTPQVGIVRRTWRVLLLLVVVLGAVMGCGSEPVLVPTPTSQVSTAIIEDLQVVASDSLRPAIQAAASAYHRGHLEVRITVLPRASSWASRALQQGDADVAVVTWLTGDLPEDAWIQPVSRDGLAVVVNTQNGLPGTTMTQLQELFQGRLENWATWGGLPGPPQLVSRETASGAFAFFQAWVMRDARVTLNALLAPSTQAVLDFVSDEPLAVGYASTAGLDGRVRAVAVNGVPPSQEAIAAGLYPMTRTHFVVTLSEPDGAARGFVQWLLAEQGQSVLEAHGFVGAPQSP